MARLGIESVGLRKEEAGMLCHQPEHSSPRVARSRLQSLNVGCDECLDLGPPTEKPLLATVQDYLCVHTLGKTGSSDCTSKIAT